MSSSINKSRGRIFAVRGILPVVLAGGLFFAIGPQANSSAPSEPFGARAASRLIELAARLVESCPDALDATARSAIVTAQKAYNYAQFQGDAADRFRTEAGKQMLSALERVPGALEIAASQTSAALTVDIPFHSTTLVVYRKGAAENAPDLAWKTLDLSSGAATVELADAANFLYILELRKPPKGTATVPVRLGTKQGRIAEIALTTRVPELYPVHVGIEEDPGGSTEAAVGLYTEKGQLIVPPSALDFTGSGASYAAEQYRDHRNARFWPGGQGFKRCFFVRGGFDVELAPGSYRLIVSKGPEYLAVDRIVTVAARPNSEKVALRRWIDMPAKGWISGDSHIHYERPDQESNKRLVLWAQAEDVHVGNVLRMGDARETYFEQYAFGKAGRFRYPQGVFVPGQEDPRTGVIGHTINLNISRPVRNTDMYYSYDRIFDQVRREGGLSGYAHVNFPIFQVERDMTINVPRGKVDFVEICEFGNLSTRLYYQFLDLGYKLPATAGSDAPYGGSVGDSRVYVYTGGSLDPDRWFDGLKRGRTFVTLGPMLEFTVDGKLPGDVLQMKKGASLKVHARAMAGSEVVRLTDLEVVANGKVIRSARPAGNSAELDFDVPAEESMWLAARVSGAHTSPIYVTVDGGRHWNGSEAGRLIAERLRTLDGLEKLAEAEIPAGERESWENREAFARSRQQLRTAMGEARRAYVALQSSAPPRRENALTAEEAREGFQLLFDGETLNNWEPRLWGPKASAWFVRDGVLTWQRGGGSWLRSKRTYDDFILRLEYRTGGDTNSGIFLRSSAGDLAKDRMELQIFDDYGKLPDIHCSGSLYGVVAPRKNTARPAGEWNTVEITLAGRHISVLWNGETIQDVNLDDPSYAKAENGPLSGRPRAGYIGLQAYGRIKPAEFRNIRIKALKP